jgi:hypothetical protein
LLNPRYPPFYAWSLYHFLKDSSVQPSGHHE